MRVYEATGRDTKDVMLAFPSEVASAKEVNFMEDHLADLSAQGKQIRFDLSAFQIKTLSVRLVSDGGR